MKLVTSFFLSGLHVNPILCKSKAPFNPILGETYHVSKEDGTLLYIEQTAHHPPTSNFYMIGPNKCFELFGYGIINSSLTGANSIKGWRDGKVILKFKDGAMMTFQGPDARINGLMMGNRTYNISGTLVVKDYTNKIESITAFPYKVKQFPLILLG